MEEALSEQPGGFVIEFTGLPGSGKSTLAHALADRLRQGPELVSEPTYELNHRSTRWHRVATKTRCILECVLTNPRGSLEATLAIARTGQRSLRDLLNTTLNMLYICGLRRAVARRPGIHVLDQGVLQQVWSIRFSASRSLPLAGFGRLGQACFGSGSGGAVIFVDVKPETVMERLTVRSGRASRLERRLSRETHLVELGAAEDALAEARGAVSTLVGGDQGIHVETVSNEDSEDFETTAEGLARRLPAWARAAGPAASVGDGNGG
jgi:ABC-type dipeptide/oligopeptide/nickel transport system ATPase subunit